MQTHPGEQRCGQIAGFPQALELTVGQLAGFSVNPTLIRLM
jgi:hypothetical protein